LISTVFGVVILFSVIVALGANKRPAISALALGDLKKIKSEVSIDPADLIVARHGLEWWTGWVLDCRTGKEYCLKPEDWDHYPAIFLLRQKAGNNYPGQQGAGQFAEFPVPESAEKILSNTSFELFKLNRPLTAENFPGELPLLQGEVKSINGDRLTVQGEGYRQTVIIDSLTRFISGRPRDLKPGMRVDIWGHRTPFSLNIKAQRITVR
jgi:hypothetical protein